MSKNIYQIYEELFELGITDEKFYDLYSGYKQWLDFKSKPRPFGVAYFDGENLLSMPYPIKGLERREIGIEVGGVFFLDVVAANVCCPDISAKVLELRKLYSRENLQREVYDEMISNLQFTLPTERELREMFNAVNLVKDRFCYKFGRMGSYWINPSANHPKNTLAVVDYAGSYSIKSVCPNNEYPVGVIRPVIHQRAGKDFIGAIDTKGVPSDTTAKYINSMLLKCAV